MRQFQQTHTGQIEMFLALASMWNIQDAYNYNAVLGHTWGLLFYDLQQPGNNQNVCPLKSHNSQIVQGLKGCLGAYGEHMVGQSSSQWTD